MPPKKKKPPAKAAAKARQTASKKSQNATKEKSEVCGRCLTALHPVKQSCLPGRAGSFVSTSSDEEAADSPLVRTVPVCHEVCTLGDLSEEYPTGTPSFFQALHQLPYDSEDEEDYSSGEDSEEDEEDKAAQVEREKKRMQRAGFQARMNTSKFLITSLLDKAEAAHPGFAAGHSDAVPRVFLKGKEAGEEGAKEEGASVEELLAVAKKAKLGVGSETVEDETLRSTMVVDPDAITLEWDEADKKRLLEEVATGLRYDYPLKAELHDVLIYRPGDFFLPHVDAQKCKGHVMTLSVDLGVRSEGGNKRRQTQPTTANKKKKATKAKKSDDIDISEEAKKKVSGGMILFSKALRILHPAPRKYSRSRVDKLIDEMDFRDENVETDTDDEELDRRMQAAQHFMWKSDGRGSWAAWWTTEIHEVIPLLQGLRVAAIFNVLVADPEVMPNPRPLKWHNTLAKPCTLAGIPFEVLSLMASSYLTPRAHWLFSRACRPLWRLLATTNERLSNLIQYQMSACCVNFYAMRYNYSTDGQSNALPPRYFLRQPDRMVVDILQKCPFAKDLKANHSAGVIQEIKDDPYERVGVVDARSLVDDFRKCRPHTLYNYHRRKKKRRQHNGDDNDEEEEEVGEEEEEEEEDEPELWEMDQDVEEERDPSKYQSVGVIAHTELDRNVVMEHEIKYGTKWTSPLGSLPRRYGAPFWRNIEEGLYGNSSTFSMYAYKQNMLEWEWTPDLMGAPKQLRRSDKEQNETKTTHPLPALDTW